jgi:glycosyltransferase involved in cell wall biosynthesis
VTALVPAHTPEPSRQSDGSLTILRQLRRTPLPLTFTDIVETARRGRRVDGGGFDVVLAHSASSALGIDAARLAAPLALVFHASVPREARFDRERLALGPAKLAGYAMVPALSILQKQSLRRADRVLVLSEYSRTLALEDAAASPDAITVVRGGVDAEQFHPLPDREGVRARLDVSDDLPLLLTVRRLEPRMGIENLLEAVASLRGTRPLKLAVAGTGSLATELRRLSSDLGIADQVTFLDGVSDTSLLEWYNAADLFVLPTVAYEGFGMATVESLATGTPVVGTPIGATPEILGPLEPRLLAASSDSEDLAAAIDTALSLADDDLRRRCRKYAVERFAWQNVLPLWEAALAQLAR